MKFFLSSFFCCLLLPLVLLVILYKDEIKIGRKCKISIDKFSGSIYTLNIKIIESQNIEEKEIL